MGFRLTEGTVPALITLNLDFENFLKISSKFKKNHTKDKENSDRIKKSLS